jgi:invasion protein IalB
MTFRNIATALICILLAGAVTFVTILYLANQNVSAQTPAQPNQVRPAPQPPPAKPAPAPQSSPAKPAPAPAAAPAAPSGPVRTETITYDNWTVTCRDTVDGKSKKVCVATLPMRVQQQNQVVNLGTWLILHNKEGALVSVVQTPQVDMGVLISKGVELKIGDGKPRKMSYFDCTPQHCESTLAMDDATIKEVVAAANSGLVVTFWKADDTVATIALPSIKGVDKAIAAVR